MSEPTRRKSVSHINLGFELIDRGICAITDELTDGKGTVIGARNIWNDVANVKLALDWVTYKHHTLK